MLQTTDSCFPKEVSLCSLLLPETRSRRFKKKCKIEKQRIVSRSAQVASSRDIEIELFLPFLSPLPALLILCPSLFIFLEIREEVSRRQTVVSPLLRIRNPEQPPLLYRAS